ncbi:hypothetical protein [Paenibacillus sp. Soil522]|uniref:hypothetical protein n=1 Tax=Paenibacillus sp. Soil522 TaxID=1736388 RepID=UPI000701D162|nr:hypothetical protein [Paenibacillus sp. Soil522]KRE45002.1 hypothetical protein ASG81_15095 [Paenibacillus sp. Soil522]
MAVTLYGCSSNNGGAGNAPSDNGGSSKRGGDPSLTISAVGHAHLGLAWLWPIRETIRKGRAHFPPYCR